MPEPISVDRTVERVEALLDEFQERERAEELVRALMELYGAGLARMLEIAARCGAGLPERLADDKLTASLLVIHGLHPVDAETRARRALERLAGRLDSDLVLQGIADGVARVRVERSRAPSIGAAIEHAIREAAPEVERVEVDGIPAIPAALVQISCPTPVAERS